VTRWDLRLALRNPCSQRQKPIMSAFHLLETTIWIAAAGPRLVTGHIKVVAIRADPQATAPNLSGCAGRADKGLLSKASHQPGPNAAKIAAGATGPIECHIHGRQSLWNKQGRETSEARTYPRKSRLSLPMFFPAHQFPTHSRTPRQLYIW
jgi:hypothetical protein